MPNWVVSCHGYSDTKAKKMIALTTRRSYVNCYVPKGVELVTYTKQGVNLSMDEGWKLWELLVVKNDEATAYGRRHKSKTGKNVVDYGLAGPHDANDWVGWLYQPQGNPPVSIESCGLFEVGNKTPMQTFQPGMPYGTLGDVLGRAKKAGVKRVYYLACQQLG